MKMKEDNERKKITLAAPARIESSLKEKKGG